MDPVKLKSILFGLDKFLKITLFNFDFVFADNTKMPDPSESYFVRDEINTGLDLVPLIIIGP